MGLLHFFLFNHFGSVFIIQGQFALWLHHPTSQASWVFLSEARILITKYEGNTTTKIKSRILELFDRAIAHSYSGTAGWERIMIFISHIHKALLLPQWSSLSRI